MHRSLSRAAAAALLLTALLVGSSRADEGPGAGEGPAKPARDPYAVGWLGAVFGKPASGPGIAIVSVDPAGPAKAGGLQAGDILFQFESRPIDDAYKFLTLVKGLDPGTKIGLDVTRGDQRLHLELTLGAKRVRASLEDSAARALDWLVQQQLPAGAWPRASAQLTEGHVAPCAYITALALLAMASAPEAARAKHAQALERATAYLLANQGPEGWVGNADEAIRLQNYTTSLAVQALLRVDARKHAEPIRKMRDYLEKAQLAEGNKVTEFDWHYGSWNYYDELRNYSLRGDVSIVSFVLEGLHASALAADSPVWKKALVFLRRCQSLEDDPGLVTEQDDGGFFFNPRASKAGEVVLAGNRVKFRSYGSATCDGLRSLLNAGVPRDDRRVQSAYAWLQKNYTLRENPGFLVNQPIAYWNGILFYFYHGLAKALHAYGEETLTTADGQPHYWAREIGDWLSTLQNKAGYWVNVNNVMNEDDPLQATCLALLALDVVLQRVK